MTKAVLPMLILIAVCLLLTISPADACTNLLVTKGASADCGTMITYTCDGEFVPHLAYRPAADHAPGDSVKIENWHGDVRGWIKQVPHTYAVVDMINEHQLAISETTSSGREELVNPDGILGYWDLIDLALQRAKTAREAITVMTDLVAEYGYNSSGETFSIADPHEVWIMEMFGPGPGGTGAEWVALRIPDGYISCHANKARIGQFPLDDPQNCRYSDNAISFAVEKGFYDPDSGEPFRFCEAYCPATPKNQRYADTRVWSIFRRAAPSQDFSPDYHRAVAGTEPYPLWIKPDARLSLEDVMTLMRDHYEGTPYDMTLGVDAGPYGSPYRWRPMHWVVDSLEYAWERPISTQQTGFSFIAQCRDWLPDPIGGVYWYGVDDTWFTCYTPLYCGITDIPKSHTVGDLNEFSWESAWWVFNFVSNICNLKYSYMIEDILAVRQELEGSLLAMQAPVEKTAKELAKGDPELLARFLTNYSVQHAEQIVRRWRQLGEELLVKYNDGYVKNEKGRPTEQGYPETWLRKVIRERPEQFLLPVIDEVQPESRLID
ncbi:MAG: C69 family dipeptidase [candidate division Zixibacteria bacterium]|nr:C69 family dipeptidase [candidate division Zixibacteria bacterium]